MLIYKPISQFISVLSHPLQYNVLSITTQSFKSPMSNEDLANAYNDYINSLNDLFNNLNDSSLSLNKSLFSFKLTERDEIKISLANTERLALANIRIEQPNEKFNIVINNTFNKEDEKKSKIPKKRNKLENGKINDDIKSTIDNDDEENSSPVIVDPIKLIHGGFTTPQVKSSQQKLMKNLNLITNVLHKRDKVLRLLDK